MEKFLSGHTGLKSNKRSQKMEAEKKTNGHLEWKHWFTKLI